MKVDVKGNEGKATYRPENKVKDDGNTTIDQPRIHCLREAGQRAVDFAQEVICSSEREGSCLFEDQLLEANRSLASNGYHPVDRTYAVPIVLVTGGRWHAMPDSPDTRRSAICRVKCQRIYGRSTQYLTASLSISGKVEGICQL